MPVRRKCFPSLLYDCGITETIGEWQQKCLPAYANCEEPELQMQSVTLEESFVNNEESIDALLEQSNNKHVKGADVKAIAEKVNQILNSPGKETAMKTTGDLKHEDGVLIDVINTELLHSFIDYDMIRSSLQESPIRWKVIPQLADLSKKHSAAICGSVVFCTVDGPPYENDMASHALLSPKKVNNCATPAPVELPPPIAPVRRARGSKSLKSDSTTKDQLDTSTSVTKSVSKSKLKKENTKKPKFSLGSLFASKRVLEDVNDFVKEKSPDEVHVQASPDPKPPKGRRSRGKRSHSPTSNGPHPKTSRQTYAAATPTEHVELSDSTIGECCSKCDTPSDSAGNVHITDTLLLCSQCVQWLTSFLRSLSRLHETACILPTPCYQQEKPKTTASNSNTSELCSQCKFQSFIALLGIENVMRCKEIMTGIPEAAKDILSRLQKDGMAAMRENEVIQEARISRCEEYAHQLSTRKRHRNSSSAFSEDQRENKLSQRQQRLLKCHEGTTKDSSDCGQLRPVAAWACKLWKQCSLCSSQSMELFHCTPTDTTVCLGCLRRYQDLLKKPLQTFQCPHRAKKTEYAVCPDGMRCEACFFMECSRRVPQSVMLPPQTTSRSLLQRYRLTYSWEANIVCAVCDTQLEQMLTSHNGTIPEVDSLARIFHFYQLQGQLDGSVLVCEYCLWTFMAAMKRMSSAVELQCKRGGTCSLLHCGVCLARFCVDFLPPDNTLPIPVWALEAMKWATEKLSRSNQERQRTPALTTPVATISTAHKVRMKLPTNYVEKSRPQPQVVQEKSDEETDNGVSTNPAPVRGRGRGRGRGIGRVSSLLTRQPSPEVEPTHHRQRSPPKHYQDFVEDYVHAGSERVRHGPPNPGRGRRIKQVSFSLPSAQSLSQSQVAQKSKSSSHQPHFEEENCVYPSSEEDDVEEDTPILSSVEVSQELGRIRLAGGHLPPATTNSCVSCGQSGITLNCISCKDAYHFYCIERVFRPKNKNYFVCRKCTRCQLCRKADACELHCAVCSTFYHPACIPYYPPASSPRQATWMCPECATCRECHSRYSASVRNGSSTGGSVEWSNESDLCLACQHASMRSENCPECGRISRPGGKEALECVICHNWVHRPCARLSHEETELLNQNPGKNVAFRCSSCSHSSDCTITVVGHSTSATSNGHYNANSTLYNMMRNTGSSERGRGGTMQFRK